MNLPSFIGGRLSLRRDSRRPSAGVVIAVTGIAVSFVVMCLAVSIVIGFKDEIVHKLTGFNAQITILPPTTSPDGTISGPITFSKSLENKILEVVPDAEMSLSINQPAVFKTDSAFQGVIIHGMDSHGAWDFVKENIVSGQCINPLTGDNNGIVISRTTADALGISPEQKLMTHFFDGNNLRTRNLTVTGIYDSHFTDFDKSIAFAPISLLQNIYDVDSLTATSIEIRDIESGDIDRLSENLYMTFVRSAAEATEDTGITDSTIYRVENLNTQCSLYINWLNLLDTNVAVLIVLMAFVSAFTLISSLFIIILERVNMIGLFKAMGATNVQIRSIFIYMAQRLVVRGLMIGNIIGIGIILLQQHLHILPLDADAYYLNYVPMHFSWLSIVALNLGIIVVSLIILILPSYLISSMSPAKSIRYE